MKKYADTLLTQPLVEAADVQKKMCQTFLPARLVNGKMRTYILYYQTNPVTGIRERFRETFDLNRIKSKQERLKRARQIIKEINERLPHGYPFESFIGSNQRFLDAIQEAVDLKCRITDRRESKNAWTSMQTIITDFIDQYKLKEITLDQFDQVMANKFLRWAITDNATH